MTQPAAPRRPVELGQIPAPPLTFTRWLLSTKRIWLRFVCVLIFIYILVIYTFRETIFSRDTNPSPLQADNTPPSLNDIRDNKLYKTMSIWDSKHTEKQKKDPNIFHAVDWLATDANGRSVDGWYPGPHPKGDHKLVRTPDPSTMDIVYTWVNGSDPVHAYKRLCIKGKFQEAVDLVKKQYSKANREFLMASSRDRDNGELRYSLRSLEMYMAWNKGGISIVTPQVAEWIDRTAPRLRFIHQDTLIPFAESRHTGNTNGIEPFLHRIPFQSDIFLQFNDDYFLIQQSQPGDFYDVERNEAALLMERGVIHPNPDNVGPGKKVWESHVFYSNQVLSGFLGRSASRLFLKHAPYVYCRAMNAAVLSKWQDKIKAMPNGHAVLDVVLPYLHHYGLMENPEAILRELKHQKNRINDIDGWWPTVMETTKDEATNNTVVRPIAKKQRPPWHGCPGVQARVGDASRSRYGRYTGNQTDDAPLWSLFEDGRQKKSAYVFLNINEGWEQKKGREPYGSMQQHLERYFPNRSVYERADAIRPLTPLSLLTENTTDFMKQAINRSNEIIAQKNSQHESPPITASAPADADNMYHVKQLNEFDLAFIVAGDRVKSSVNQTDLNTDGSESSICVAVCAAVRSATQFGLTAWRKGNIFIGGDLKRLSQCKTCVGGMRRKNHERFVEKVFSFNLQFLNSDDRTQGGENETGNRESDGGIQFLHVDTSLIERVQVHTNDAKSSKVNLCSAFSCQAAFSDLRVFDELLLTSPSPGEQISYDLMPSEAHPHKQRGGTLRDGYQDVLVNLIHATIAEKQKMAEREKQQQIHHTKRRPLIVLDAVNPIFGEAVMYRHLERLTVVDHLAATPSSNVSPSSVGDASANVNDAVYRVKLSCRERGGVLSMRVSGPREYLLTWPLPSPTSRFEHIDQTLLAGAKVPSAVQVANQNGGDIKTAQSETPKKDDKKKKKKKKGKKNKEETKKEENESTEEEKK